MAKRRTGGDFIDEAPEEQDEQVEQAEQASEEFPPEFLSLAERVRMLEDRVAALELAGEPPPAEPPVPPAKLQPRPGDESLPRWRVRCSCPTPLHFPVMEVHAADAHQAKLTYCRQNGISDSSHPWSIERI